jgi:hypothetical protein
MPKPQYGYAHRQARKRALDMMVHGALCPRCNRPMYKWQRLQLGHSVSVAMGGSDSPTRIEHGACNERAGQRIGVVIKRMRKRSNSRNKGMDNVGDRGGSRGAGSAPTRRRLPKW